METLQTKKNKVVKIRLMHGVFNNKINFWQIDIIDKESGNINYTERHNNKKTALSYFNSVCY